MSPSSRIGSKKRSSVSRGAVSVVVSASWLSRVQIALSSYSIQSLADFPLPFEGAVAHLYTQAFWVSVGLFGVGYAIVAHDPGRNHGILLLAALGKTYVFVVFTAAWLRGSMGTLALVGGIGDLVFAAVFFWFLWHVNVRS